MTVGGEITNPLEKLVGYQLRRASAVVMPELVAQFDGLGLRLSEGSVLMLIDQNPGINQSSIGKALDIKRANMAPLIAKLTKHDLVQRRPIDGRSFGLYLSKRGESLAAAVMRFTADHEARLIAALPREWREGFIGALQSLRRGWAGASSVVTDGAGDNDDGPAEAMVSHPRDEPDRPSNRKQVAAG